MSNNNVKTKKIVKKRLKLKGVLLLTSFFVSLYFGINALLQINIKNIIITGNEFVKDSSIIKTGKLNNHLKYLTFSKEKVCADIKGNHLISKCTIKRKLNFSIEVIVEENKPLFYYIPNNSIVLSDGTQINEDNSYGVPTLVNAPTEKVLNGFIDGLKDINGDIIRSISEIEYSPTSSKDGSTFIDESRFILSMVDGNTVIINNRRLDVLNYYEKIYATLGDKKGTLSLDCDFGNYPFKEYGEDNEL